MLLKFLSALTCPPLLFTHTQRKCFFLSLSNLSLFFFSLKVIKWKTVGLNIELQTCSAGSVVSGCSRAVLRALAETERSGKNPSKVPAGGTAGSWHPPIPGNASSASRHHAGPSTRSKHLHSPAFENHIININAYCQPASFLLKISLGSIENILR